MNIMIICLWIGHAATESIMNESNPYIEALEKKPWESVQAYVEVRPGAFMFYWLYYADGTRAGAAHMPLVIWIQGGPGLAATGIGNFMEIGPLDLEMQPRNHTWVRGHNVLLIDHPVGTGFSYVTDKSLLVTSDQMLADDLVKTITVFLESHEKFRETPTYIFGQSYGGKIGPRLAYTLLKATERNILNMNLKGLGLGSAFVDPKETIRVTPEFLYNMGVYDRSPYMKAAATAKKIRYFINNKKNAAAFKLYRFFSVFCMESELDYDPNNWNHKSQFEELAALEEKVNHFVKPTLKMINQSLHWTYNTEDIKHSLEQDLFLNSTNFLELLLSETMLKIVVYNGNLDTVCPLAGASNWVHNLKWPGADEFRAAKRVPINGHGNGMYKKARQLSFWSVFGSGHWVPEDNPAAMEHILEFIMSSTD